ncbi:MAG: DUF4252 domain-containing protein [Bacteroidetes bacterium]|nr:DUF4252 domain-containing protein [Bacteroidota bacterium]MCL6100479.1 DUF4252 domain-containing protein [Bacteroidota bacterium]
MKALKTLITLTLLLSVSAFAQQKGDYSKEPGYFNYSKFLPAKIGEPTTEVNLEEPLLKMAGQMAEDKKEDVGNMISALKLVNVNEFDVDKNQYSEMESAIESMDKDLLGKQWDRIIRTKSKNDFTNIYVKAGSDGKFMGLVVASLNKNGKATFVNIVGRIDLDTIKQLSKQFNFSTGEKSKEKKDQEKK